MSDITAGQLWRDQWGRTLRITDADGDPVMAEWTPGGICPSPIRRKHLLSGYALVNAVA